MKLQTKKAVIHLLQDYTSSLIDKLPLESAPLPHENDCDAQAVHRGGQRVKVEHSRRKPLGSFEGSRL